MSEATPDPSMIDEALIERLQTLAAAPTRRLVGIVGAPGAGKSLLTEALVEAMGPSTTSLPMDGFHLSQRQLDHLGRHDRKGAPDTFDSAGYLALLTRVRAAFEVERDVYAPGFYRDIEEPIAASLVIPARARLVLTEGNYLLLDEPDWRDVAGVLDEIWYLEIDDAQRESWLLARHQRFGRAEADARQWIAQTDRPNAERIAASAHRADRRLFNDGRRIRFA